MRDWNGREIDAGQSRGGVLAVANYSDNLLCPMGPPWPPSALVQKLYQSKHAECFDDVNRSIVTSHLGYYCDLQSLHSEDAITWSFFGPLAGLPSVQQAHFQNWLMKRFGLAADNRACEITLFRRVPHPETLVSGGPEIDFALIGDKAVALGEAKWRSPVGAGQGVAGDQDQIELRQRFLADYGRKIFGPRQLIVVLLSRNAPPVDAFPAVMGVAIAFLQWADLCDYAGHPLADEFARYHRWKCKHTQEG